jgi:hypothetical protein
MQILCAGVYGEARILGGAVTRAQARILSAISTSKPPMQHKEELFPGVIEELIFQS